MVKEYILFSLIGLFEHQSYHVKKNFIDLQHMIIPSKLDGVNFFFCRPRPSFGRLGLVIGSSSSR